MSWQVYRNRFGEHPMNPWDVSDSQISVVPRSTLLAPSSNAPCRPSLNQGRKRLASVAQNSWCGPFWSDALCISSWRPSATVDFPTLPVLCVQAMKRLLPARCSIATSDCSLICCTPWFPWIERYCFCRKWVAIRVCGRLDSLPQSGACRVRLL